jgi:hypothetical protein
VSQNLADRTSDEPEHIQPHKWIGLADALALVLRAAEVEPKAQSRRKRPTHSAPATPSVPGPDELGKLLRRHLGTTVDPPPLSKMKARSLERKFQLTPGKLKPQGRDRRPLSIADIALVNAHLKLMTLFRAGRVRTRAIYRSASVFSRLDGGPTAAAHPGPTAMSPDQWTARQGEDKRKRGRSDASPIPDYRENWLAPVIDIVLGTETEFRSIEVLKNDLLAELRITSSGHEVAEGIFRVVSPGQGRPKLEIDYLGRHASIKPTLGLGAIGILLSRPDVAISWEHLAGAATAFSEGMGAERALIRGEAVIAGGAPDNGTKISNGTRDRPLDQDATTKSRHGTDHAVQRNRNEATIIKNQLALERAKLPYAKPEARSLLQKQIADTEDYLKKLENDLRRRVTPNDKLRQAIYRALENALSRLADVCMPLAVHLGTLHADRRTSLYIDKGTIFYQPETPVVWATAPRILPPRG